MWGVGMSLENEEIICKEKDGIEYIPEIVINALTVKDAKEALKRGIEALDDVNGIIEVSAGNYGGSLGKFKFYLKEVLGDD